MYSRCVFNVCVQGVYAMYVFEVLELLGGLLGFPGGSPGGPKVLPKQGPSIWGQTELPTLGFMHTTVLGSIIGAGARLSEGSFHQMRTPPVFEATPGSIPGLSAR